MELGGIMKVFLIVIGCILLYIFGAFVTFVMGLYIDRSELGAEFAYEDIDESDIGIIFAWPLTILFIGGYLMILKLKKYAIAITEVLYQIHHNEEDKDE